MTIIAIEGIDSSGKDLQSKLLFEYLLSSRPAPHRLASFPDYTTTTGKAIKGLLEEDWWPSFRLWPGVQAGDQLRAELLQSLMTQNRYEKYDLLASYKTRPDAFLVCDRYYVSGLVYGQCDGLDLEYLISIHAALPPADLWILVDITADESVRRRPHRRDEYERRVGFMDKVRDKYLELFSNTPVDGKWVVIDGMNKPEDVHEDIRATVRRYML